MTRPAWLRDSITLRFAMAIAASAAVCLLLNLVADALLGGPAFQPPAQARLLEQLPGIVRRLDAAPGEQRDALARAAATGGFSVTWHPAGSVPAGTPPTLGLITGAYPDTPALSAALRDGSAVVFTVRASGWSFAQPSQWLVRVAILLLTILAVSVTGAARLARPIDAFAAAARRFGGDPKAAPVTPQGPLELQQAIVAFNAMQSQIQRFVAGQAAMFAAISHDLRTPLTRMRLRGEFIADREEQARLFRDVDEMQNMVAGVLTFLRDNAADEATTRLDLAELLRSIADDYADLGSQVAYSGPPHLAFPGRPVGLRRALGNLVDNAVKYGTQATIHLQCVGNEIRITITDQGPGIPADALEGVFAPFKRLETSRNRNTGGMGLGLTAARAGLRAHGGDVSLSNVPGGGLRASITLPITGVKTCKEAVLF